MKVLDSRFVDAGAIAVMLAGLTLAADGQDTRPPRPIPADAQIIFASDRDHELDKWGMPANELYVATIDGVVTRITYDKLSDNHFEVSPNRRYVAVNRFSRGPADKNAQHGALSLPNASAYFPLRDWKELWIVDTVQGTERRVVPQIDAGYGGLAWSPDSKWVYFATPSVTGKMDIVRVNIDTQRVEVVTRNLARLLGYGPDKKVWVSDVDLSQDGERLAFVVSGPDVNEGKDKPKIGTMKVDGSEAHMVTDGGPLAAGKRGVWPIGDFDPDMSPDGTRVAFERTTDVGFVTPSLTTFDIVVADMDGAHVKDISPPDNHASEFIPSWGPDDEGKIVFTRLDPKVGMGPVVYDPQTGTRTLIPIGGNGTHVQWIPSGRVQCQGLICTAREKAAMEAIWHSNEGK